MWFALAMSGVLVLYNNVANRWPLFQGAAYVPLNLTVTAAVTLLCAVSLGLSRSELGLTGDRLDVAVSVVALNIFVFGVFTIARSRHAHRIADKRVADLRGGKLLYQVLVRVPLGTAVTEELLFRGVLFALWSEAGQSVPASALWASIAFGLWHITPTIVGVRMNDAHASSRKVGTAVVGAIILTTLAGLGLTWLRLWTGGLVAPIVLHAGVNSIGTLAAVEGARACGKPPRPFR
ncbi:MAG TPA: CPBP family intramembrane glutamic endopeptidase [Actinomycetota bacterium]|nr:CPBP family intramembrane glutamic endopeptidase [Actinomycetota bacterium]